MAKEDKVSFRRVRGKIVPIRSSGNGGDDPKRKKKRTTAQLQSQLRSSQKKGRRSDVGSFTIGSLALAGGIGVALPSARLLAGAATARAGKAALARGDDARAVRFARSIQNNEAIRKALIGGVKPFKLAIGATVAALGIQGLRGVERRRERRSKKQSKLRSRIRESQGLSPHL